MANLQSNRRYVVREHFVLMEQRFKFFQRKQEEFETYDRFLEEIKTIARRCNFGDLEDSMVRIRFVLGLRDDTLREKLLEKTELSMSSVMEYCESGYTSEFQQTANDASEESAVHPAVFQSKMNGSMDKHFVVDCQAEKDSEQKEVNNIGFSTSLFPYQENKIKLGITKTNKCFNQTLSENDDGNPENTDKAVKVLGPSNVILQVKRSSSVIKKPFKKYPSRSVPYLINDRVRSWLNFPQNPQNPARASLKNITRSLKNGKLPSGS